MASTAAFERTFPQMADIGGVQVTLRLMERRHRDGMVAFARALSEHDLLFLRTDITDPAVVDDWLHNIETGSTVTVLAEVGGRIAGYGSLHHSEILWTRHLGEIRILVDPEFRQRGFGRRLAREMLALARELGLQKIFVQMTVDQRGARQVFEHLGFKPEALLTDWVIVRDGTTHDLLILSHDVAGFSV